MFGFTKRQKSDNWVHKIIIYIICVLVGLNRGKGEGDKKRVFFGFVSICLWFVTRKGFSIKVEMYTTTILILLMALTGAIADKDEKDQLDVVLASSAGSQGRSDYYYNPLTNVAPGKSLYQIPESRRRYACTIDNVKYYEHGELFHYDYHSRCITYRCEYGDYHIYQEGCLNHELNKCVPISYSWTTRCHTFFCTKKEVDGVWLYEGVRSQISCYDSRTGMCRRVGEFFAHVDDTGTYRQRCTCRITTGRQEFECYDTDMQVLYSYSETIEL